jgi:hypothetical protein
VIVEFDAPLWLWDARRTDAWTFVSLPADLADDILDAVSVQRGFGSVRVEASVGSTTWRTSVFPSAEQRTFVLPVKRAVRRAEGVDVGDVLGVRLRVLDA